VRLLKHSGISRGETVGATVAFCAVTVVGAVETHISSIRREGFVPLERIMVVSSVSMEVKGFIHQEAFSCVAE